MSSAPREGYFASRWHSGIGLPVLLWRDMLGIGTLINVTSTFAALMLLVQDVDARWAATVHFAPLPYNAFLLACVWRSPHRTRTVLLVSGVWFALMSLV